jgi:Na+-transporting NADH:ubiquinone oxidoreductase subunit NqrC
MWKTRKFIIVAVLIAVVLVATVAGVAMAQDGQGAGPRQTMLTRVAQILGIDQAKLEAAFKQALSEQKETLKQKGTAALDQGLDKLVQDKKITQAQADAFKAWLKSKPADIPNIGIKGLEKLLKDGKINQTQFDAYKAWLEKKPDIPLPKRPDFNGPRPGKGFFPGAKPVPQSQTEPAPTI